MMCWDQPRSGAKHMDTSAQIPAQKQSENTVKTLSHNASDSGMCIFHCGIGFAFDATILWPPACSPQAASELTYKKQC